MARTRMGCRSMRPAGWRYLLMGRGAWLNGVLRHRGSERPPFDQRFCLLALLSLESRPLPSWGWDK